MASASLMLSLAQLISTDAMRGRVMSVYNLAFRAGIPIGALALGKLIPTFGVSKSLAGSGLALTLLAFSSLVLRKDSAFQLETSGR
jgi:predicted MFS family arabinose efflux permease